MAAELTQRDAASPSPASPPAPLPRPEPYAVQSLPVRPAPPHPPAPRPRQAPPPSFLFEGVVCLVVAAGWACAAQAFYETIGTMVLMQGISKGLGSAMDAQDARAEPPAPAAAPPTDRRAAPAKPTGRRGGGISFFPPMKPPKQPLQRAAPAAGEQRSSLLANEPAPEAVVGDMLKWGEITRVSWALLTFLLIGVILASGLSLVARGTGWRLALVACLALGVGGVAGWLIGVKVSHPVQMEISWKGWLLGLPVSRFAWAAHVLLAGMVALPLSLVSLRPRSRPDHWGTAAIVAMFLGTVASLVAIALLETRGGFPVQPSWIYAAVAFVQSLFAWVLMISLHGPGRRVWVEPLT